MKKSVFVANRGEIAVRIARAAQSVGLSAVGLYTPDDAHSPHRWTLDACYRVEQANAYNDAELLLRLARACGASYVHPGYGFLSQSAEFAEQVTRAGLWFVGPSATSMRALGDKGAARARAGALGIPTIPGVQELTDDHAIHEAAGRLGFPLLLKAPNAGGGRGLVPIESAASLTAGIAQTRRVAGPHTSLVLERLLTGVRHVEVQVVADGTRALALGTRECSTQRRQQKLIEEAPARCVPAATAEAMQRQAEALFVDAGFCGVGTAEFLFDAQGDYFFLEINPRLQVEHTVTEEIFGVDLVAWQLQLARGEPLPPAPGPPRGHAIEARVVAEDPRENFAPQTGTLLEVAWPGGPGVRVDAGVAQGSYIGPHYDSLLAKVIAWAPSREQARRRLGAALQEVHLLGVQTNVAHLCALLEADAFCRDQLHTRWLSDVPLEPATPPAALLTTEGQAGGPIAWAPGSCHAAPAPQDGFVSPFALSDGFGRPCSAS